MRWQNCIAVMPYRPPRGFEKLVRAIPDSAVAWYNLGLARQHGGRPAGAEKAYQKALNLDPGNVDAMVNLGLAQKAIRRFATSYAMRRIRLRPRAATPASVEFGWHFAR